MNSFFSNIKSDLPASIVVFLVAMPLCLGIALASGAPLFSGVIAGIVGGTVVALISGSSLGVSGPAAGLAVVVLNAIQDLGSFEVFLYAVIIAGIFQIILGLIGSGIIAYYFPSSVIKGMLSGIGILIFFKQIPHAFGYDKDPEGDFSFRQLDGHNTLDELSFMCDNISTGAIIVTVVSLAILIFWEQGFMKKLTFTKIIPGPLAAVISGILLNLLFQNNGLAIKGEHLVKVPVAGSISSFVGQFKLPDFSQWNNPTIYLIAITIAVVASLETLLCVEATDKLDPQKRITPTNKELVAQGIGNMLSGLIGGLPITQVIVRSSANIQSGGKTKASAFLHGLLLLACIAVIPKVLNMIPLACLAAILLVVGFKLAKPQLFIQAYKMGWEQFIPFVITVLGIFFIDFLWGIGIGLAISIFFILYNNYLIPFHVDKVAGGKLKLVLAEDVSFLNKARIRHTLNEVPDNTDLVIDASNARTIHHDIWEIINDFKKNAETRNISIEFIKSKTNENYSPFEEYNKLVKTLKK